MKSYYIQNDEVKLHIVEKGSGPTVLLLHGWPEFYYSWKYQFNPLSAKGYRVIAPDLRGFGKSDAPKDPSMYNIEKLTYDIISILDYLKLDKVIIVGHDLGAIIAWQSVLRYQERFYGIAALSVPYEGFSHLSNLKKLQSEYGDKFSYKLYFQKPDIAEREFNNNIEEFFLKIFATKNIKKEKPKIIDNHYKVGGLLDRLGYPLEEIPWLKKDDLNYFISTFKKSGFHGGINYYRNYISNLELNQNINKNICIPTFFATGEFDLVVVNKDFRQLKLNMQRYITDLRVFKIYANTYHWIHKEQYQVLNKDLLLFFESII